MVLDYSKNYNVYEKCNRYFLKVSDFLKEHNLIELPAGKYEFGNDCYVNIVEYELKEDNNIIFEAHEKFIDIQYIIMGSEKMLWQNNSLGIITKPYELENDYSLWDVKESVSFILKKDMFCIFFPQDLHCPSLFDGESKKVKKAVFKIPV